MRDANIENQTNKLTYISFQRTKLKGQFFRVVDHIPVINGKIKQRKYGNKLILSTEDGRKILKEAIKNGKPYMAARFGTTEGASFVKYWEIKLRKGSIADYPQSQVDNICLYSGFFPNSKEDLWKWAELETKACNDLDLLGVMRFMNESIICV